MNQRQTRRSLTASAMYVAVSIAGAFWLVRLAHRVTTLPPDTNEGIIVRSEFVSLWMYPTLFDLAQHPSESDACQSREFFRRYAEDRNMQKAWYLITIRGFRINGETVVTPLIRRPYEMIEPLYSEFPDVLAIAAGRPPRFIEPGLPAAKVRVIPPRFLDADPWAVVNELRTLEDASSQETAP